MTDETTKQEIKTVETLEQSPLKELLDKPVRYRMRDLIEGKTFDIETLGGVSIPVSLELMDKLITVKGEDRKPDVAEKMMFCNMIVEQRCNPYLGECWLVYMKNQNKYQPLIAAQKRIGKAMTLPNYGGYDWGWITKDGTRHIAGRESKAKREDVVGTWNEISFKDGRKPFFYEIFLAEYPGQHHTITMFLKTARDQTHKYAFANEMGNLSTEDDLQQIQPEPAYEPTTLKRADREPAKPAENVTITDYLMTFCSPVKTELVELLDKIGNAIEKRILEKYGLRLTEPQMKQIIISWADFILDFKDLLDENKKPTEVNNPLTWPKDFCEKFLAIVEDYVVPIPAEIEAIFKPSAEPNTEKTLPQTGKEKIINPGEGGAPESTTKEEIKPKAWVCTAIGCGETFDEPDYIHGKRHTPKCPKCGAIGTIKANPALQPREAGE